MKVGISSVVTGLAMLLAAAGAPVQAAAVPVRVDLTQLLAIQKFTMDEKADDEVYLVVQGVAKGQEFQQRIPSDKTLAAAPKKIPVTPKEPLSLWKGSLDDGEFALVTVTLFQGKGTDATKPLLDSLSAAEKKVAERSKKALTADDFKKLAAGTLKGEQEIITKVKDTLSREKKTDHYGGLFNVLVWNNGGKLVKRLDPVGLTFGEHNGKDAKIYTKIKYTLNNVLLKDEKGEWSEQVLEPINDDNTAVRVKMLETEYVERPGDNPTRKVTDYLAEVDVVTGEGKGTPSKWKLGGENKGYDDIHTYYNWAE